MEKIVLLALRKIYLQYSLHWSGVAPRTVWNMVEKMNIPAPLGNRTAVFQAVSTHYTARTIGLDDGTICSAQVSVMLPQELKRHEKQSYK